MPVPETCGGPLDELRGSPVREALPARGIKSVAVITPGFVTDGLETIEEIGDRGRESFLEAGGERFIRVAAVDTHPAFIRSLAELAVA